MVEKLSVQIALEGGAEIERQLANIGEAGQKAFAEVEKSATQVGGFKNLKPEEVTKKFEDLGIKGTAAFDKIQKAVATAGNFEKLVVGVQSVETGFTAIGTAAGPVVAGLIAGAAAIATAWLGVAKSINEVDTAAAKLGVSFQQFDKLRQGFLQAGISSEAVTSGLQQLKSQLDQMDVERVKKAFNELADAATRGFGAQGTAQLQLLQQAAEGVGPAAEAARKALVDLGLVPVGEQLGKVTEAFQRLGIQGSTLSEVVPQIIAKLQAMPDSVERTNLAISLLGDKLGVELVAALRTGSLTAGQFNAAMGNLTREQQIAAAQTQQSITRMSTAWDDFKANIISPVAVPLLTWLKEQLDGVNQGIQTTKQEWQALKAVFSSFTPSRGIIDILLGTQRETQNTTQALQTMGQTGAQAGQQAAQGLQLVANPLTGMPELIRTTNQALQQTGQAGAQAGQQAAQGLQLVANPLTRMPELVRTTNQALAQTGQTGQAGFQQVGAAAETTNTTVSTLGSTVAGWSWDPIAAGVSVWNGLTAAVQGFIDKLLVAIGLKEKAGGTPLAGGAPIGGGGIGSNAAGGLLGGRGTGTSDSNLAWVSRGEHIMPAHVVRQPGMLSLLEALRRGGGIPGFAEGGTVGAFLGSAFFQQINALRRVRGSLADINNTVFDTVDNVIRSLMSMMNKLTQSLMGAANQIDGVVNYFDQLANVGMGKGSARGGLLGGRGSGTSDSNLAWVSRGEYITPARAVAQPGVLAFLEALRRSGGNLRSVLDGMGRFALGGMIRGPMPAFAGGGLAGGMSNVTIQFPGLPAIGGLRASSDVVDQLHRAAALAQVRSGGRKPSRYS